MRLVVVPAALLAVIATHAGARPASAASGRSGAGACSLLTREVLLPVTPYERQARDQVFQIPPEEEAIGKTGSSCSYGGVTLQVDPFANPPAVETTIAKEWGGIQGLGDVAYFRDNRGEWAELYVRAARRVITIQMDIPTGRTADAIRPNVIALAKALLPKLR